LQWFSANGRLLATQGTSGSSLPPEVSGSVQQRGDLRELTIAVYDPDGRPPGIAGGLCSGEQSTLAVDEILEQMRWKLGTGLLVELGISVLGGFGSHAKQSGWLNGALVSLTVHCRCLT